MFAYIDSPEFTPYFIIILVVMVVLCLPTVLNPILYHLRRIIQAVRHTRSNHRW
jgi:hypothetical protein